MLLAYFNYELKHENWTDMSYPIDIRTANIREKRAALKRLGLPPPFDPVVWLDDLSEYAESTWNEETTRYLLRSMSADGIKDYYRQQSRVVDRKKPTRGSCPSKTTFEGRLKEWQRSASTLLNLYAAAVYQDQMALIREKEDVNSPAPPKALTHTWEFEAWDKKLQKLKTEESAGSYAKRDFDDSEMAMIEGFAKRLRKTTTEPDEDGWTTQIVEDQAEISDFGATIVASGLVPESSVSQNTRHIQQRRANAMSDDVPQPQKRDSRAGLHTTSTIVPSAKPKLSAPLASSDASSEIADSGARGGDIQSFTDHHGRSHHRGTSGKFVKGSSALRGLSRGMGRLSTDRSIDVALKNADEEEESHEQEESHQDEAQSSAPPTLAGLKRKASATQKHMPSQTYGLATEPTKKRVKLSPTGKSQSHQDKQPGEDVTASAEGAHLVPIEANQVPTEGQASTATPRKRLILNNSGPRPQA